MELKWLEDFIALANTRHFSRAAEAQNVTQPTFSRRIKMLEEEMGVVLINRNTLPLSLTPAGELFLASAERISAILRDTRERCQQIREQEQNRISFATSQTLYLSFWKEWLQPITDQAGLDLALILQSTAWAPPDFIRALAQGQCDLILHYWHPHADSLRELDDERFDYLPLADERLLPCTAADAQGQPRYRLPGQARAPLPYIDYHPQSTLRSLINHHLQQRPHPPQLLTMNENFHAVSVKAMIKEGFGLGWLPERLVRQSLHHGSLLPAGDARWQIPLEIRLYRRRDNPNPNLQRLWHALQAHLTSDA